MKEIHIALGTPEKFVNIGYFNVKVRDQSISVYYNINLGDKRAKMFDLNTGKEKNVEKAHQSFHTSGNSHTKMEDKGTKLFKGQTFDGSPMNDPEKKPLILGLESFRFDIASNNTSDYDSSTEMKNIQFYGFGCQLLLLNQSIPYGFIETLSLIMKVMELFRQLELEI